MLDYLRRVLPVIRPTTTWRFAGFDVLDEGVQTDSEFLNGARKRLERDSITGETVQIRGISADEGWPYDDGTFDVVVSNQVLEHVRDLDFFMAEAARVLRDGGVGVHLFPVKSVLHEGHVRIPLAHKINDHDLAVWWIEAANKLRIGRFDTYNDPGDGLHEFSVKEADRVWNYTHYRSVGAVFASCRESGLRAMLRYTPEFYMAKLRSLGGRPAKLEYAPAWEPAEWIASRVLARVSCVTLITEKRNAVRPHVGTLSN